MRDKVLVVADHSGPAPCSFYLYSGMCNIMRGNVVFRGGKPTVATMAAIGGHSGELKRYGTEDKGKNSK